MTTELTLLSRVAFRGSEVTGPRLRGLLALLAWDLRAGASTQRLVEGLWPDERPENPTKALQVLVSRTRAQLGSDVIASTPTGYRLALGEEQVDASAVTIHAAASGQYARAGEHVRALEQAEAGLALWGAAPQDIQSDDPVSQLRAERASAYRSLTRARAMALARLGRRAEAVEPLEDLADEHPWDEEVLVELLRCEAATAGTAAALTRYDKYRRALRDELGTDPGAAVQDVYQELLQGEAPVVRHGVPHEPNQLLGRDKDIAAVASLVNASRVTSIVGAGGLGKTRLAHVVSREAEQRVVHFVPLAGVGDDEDVAGEVASALGVGESLRTRHLVSSDVLGRLVDALGPGSVLLVLDNCEHVVRGAAELTRALVSMTKELRVLTTSRAPLGLSSESVYLLPELSLPTSVELFGQRARAARPDVELPVDDVAELCGHLDGLPLAVELAAARVRVMSVAEIARRLDDRFSLLRGGPRDAPQRHRTLHAVVDWSWNLLEPDERKALRALSIFQGGFTEDAANHLLDTAETLPTLENLVDQSLLKVVEGESGTRFVMLETVREFATARREEAGETGAVLDRFLGWARDFGMANHESLFGPEPFSLGEHIRAEQDNLLQALRHGIDREDGATVAATASVLAGLWTVESNFTRLASMIGDTEGLLSHYRPEPRFVDVTRTAATLYATYTFALHGPRAVRSLVILRRLPEVRPDTMIRAMSVVLATAGSDVDGSALLALCDNEEPMVAGVACCMASYFWEGRRDPERALATARRMVDAFGGHTNLWLRLMTHARIGELCLQVGEGDEAVRHLSAALDALGDRPDVIGIKAGLVLAHLHRGAVEDAARWLEAAECGQVDERVGDVTFLLGLHAEIALARGQTETGLRAWRETVAKVRAAEGPIFGIEPGTNPWTLEVEAVAVIAHAQCGRLDLVEEIAAELPGKLSGLLTGAVASPLPPVTEFPLCGALLLAVGFGDLSGGHRKSGARLIALAERFRYIRNFQPTMSAVRAREAAEYADRSVYEEAVSSYTDLDAEGLRAAALAALASSPTGRG